tara:strand:- start:44 stop:1147 length:1104 start_codon:yes stop_codon:yes gene_type:complete
MKVLKNSTKFSEIDACLKTLKINTLYSIQEIINTIKQLNLPDIEKLEKPQAYGKEFDTMDLKDIYVDMTYQRKLNLRNLLNNLVKQGGFKKGAAGTVDVAYRPNQEIDVVWDGFRRCIKAGIMGLDKIRVSRTIHSDIWTEEQCQEEEAKLFKCRNTQDKMKVEELFKASVVAKDPIALEQLELLKNCNLNVEGLNTNPKAISLGGLAEFIANFKNWKENPEESDGSGYGWDANHWINSSFIIRSVWNDPKVSGYLLRDIAWLLTINESDNVSQSYDNAEIINALSNWRKNNPDDGSQGHINQIGFKKKHMTTWYIAKNILKDNNGLVSIIESHLSEDHKSLLNLKSDVKVKFSKPTLSEHMISPIN